MTLNSKNVIELIRYGDIIKNLYIEGVKITGYTITIGYTNMITCVINETNKFSIDLGKIGIELLKLKFQQVYIKINCEKLTYVKGKFVTFPLDTRRYISINEFFDNSIDGHL